LTWLKACVLLLALANAGYFLWARGVGAAEPADAPAAAGSAPGLRLASEGSAATRSNIPAPAPGAGTSPDAVATPSAGAAGGDPAAAEATAAAAPASVGAAAAPTAVGTVPAAQNAGLLTDVKRCITVGPFPDGTEAAHAAATLRSGGYSPRERVAPAQQLGLNPGIADRTRAGNVYWVDVDLKPTDGMLNPADLQTESGRIVKLEVKACPPPAVSP
jgi:hypothetical protein